jgi:Rho guanine nucleotide exchange factor 10
MSPESKFQKRATKNRYYLWVCSVDGSNSHITILLHQPHQAQAMIKDVTAFSLTDTVITAMDHVKGRIAMMDGNHTSLKVDVECVWLGTSDKKIIVYGGTNPEQEKQITKFNVPETPTQILYNVSTENVFVSLANGDILMYHKDHEEWNLHHYKIISLENERKTITSMLPINFNIYAASGKKIFVLNGTSGEFQKSFEIQHINSDVNLMAHAGVGLWISLKHSSIICLYHTETFKHLQDINIAPHILRVTSNNSSSNSSPSIYVTALMACKGMLWVGTNVGISLTVPLPRLEGVPIISGNVNISYHAHCGPVTFFQPLITKSANNQQIATQQSTSKSSDDSNNNNIVDINNKNNNHNQTTTTQQNHVVKESKLEKQKSLEVQPSPSKMKNQLPNSPIVLRRKSHIRESDMARMSKTLPRGFSGINNYFNGSNSMRSSSSSGSSQNGSDSGCDVYGLYSDLLFVKEDFDGQMIMTPNIHEHGAVYSTLRRGNSDPDLAAIPSKVSTLDRRLKMKVGRPRSLDLSNWSMDSRSSSLYTSSGSEESMGVKYRSVSRNSSNASHKFNGGELMNINECDHQATSTPNKEAEATHQEVKEQANSNNFSAATLKNNKRKNLKNNYHQQMIDGRRTVMMLMGGRGYVNWRNVFNTPTNSGTKGNSNGINGESHKHLRSNSLTTINYKMLNSTDANIIIWEKKL